MELRHLRYFVAVAQEESITRAAALLHVSQPTLSRQIIDLEKELRVDLFEHGAKAIALTKAGRVFLEEAKAVLRRAETAVEVARAVGGGKETVINVSYAPSPTFELLPRTLRLFQQANPTVEVKLHAVSAEETARGLSSGEFDLALAVVAPRRAVPGLVSEEFCRYGLCIALSTSHPLASLAQLSIEHLLDEPVVAYTRSGYRVYNETLEGLFAPFGQRPRIVEEHDNDMSLLAAVGAGRGVAFVLETFASFSVDGVRTCALAPPPKKVGVGVIYPKKQLSPAAKNFIAAARRAAS